eukprot:tig00000190_g13847.t1
MDGIAAGFAAAARRAEDAETAALALDLLLLCEGPIPAADLEARSAAAAARPALASARRLLALEGRLMQPPDVDPDPRPGAEEDGGASSCSPGPLLEACGAGFRLTALRLARSAEDPQEALPHAVRGGPRVLGACLALIARGADPTREEEPCAGAGSARDRDRDRRVIVQLHPDVSFQAALKRAAGARDLYIW